VLAGAAQVQDRDDLFLLLRAYRDIRRERTTTRKLRLP